MESVAFGELLFLDELVDVVVIANHIGREETLQTEEVPNAVVFENLNEPILEFILHLSGWFLIAFGITGRQLGHTVLNESSCLHCFV